MLDVMGESKLSREDKVPFSVRDASWRLLHKMTCYLGFDLK